MNHPQKSRLRERHEQLIYWSSIGWDIARPDDRKGIYVLGYIKSGTNWLCHLVSTALEMPILEVWKTNLPALAPRVHHMHRFIPLDSARRRTIYIMRDGRDTMVSGYFHFVREGGATGSQLERQLGRPLAVDKIRENLADYIRFMIANRSATLDYRSHLLEWKRHRDDYATVRYEDLLTDPAGELTRALRQVTGAEPDRERIDLAVASHDFSRVTKRQKGTEDHGDFVRKGISGDWRNHFTREAATVFHDYAGDLLLDLGYETDRDWAGRID